jgi:hypothetical protein
MTFKGVHQISYKRYQVHVIGRLHYSHGNTASNRVEGRRCDRNLVPALVFGLRHVEHGQHRRRHDEERRVDEVAPRTYPPARTKRQRDQGIVAEGSILVEETIGLECLWVGI